MKQYNMYYITADGMEFIKKITLHDAEYAARQAMKSHKGLSYYYEVCS